MLTCHRAVKSTRRNRITGVTPLEPRSGSEFTQEDAQGNPIRVETRLIQKYSKTKWFMASFVWNEEQTDAFRVEGDGPEVNVAQKGVLGTEHVIPGQKGV